MDSQFQKDSGKQASMSGSVSSLGAERRRRGSQGLVPRTQPSCDLDGAEQLILLRLLLQEAQAQGDQGGGPDLPAVPPTGGGRTLPKTSLVGDYWSGFSEEFYTVGRPRGEREREHGSATSLQRRTEPLDRGWRPAVLHWLRRRGHRSAT